MSNKKYNFETLPPKKFTSNSESWTSVFSVWETIFALFNLYLSLWILVFPGHEF